jgi:hypothetical protein
MTENQNIRQKMHYANVHLDAFNKLSDIKADRYLFCAVAVQYQKKTGWVSPGVNNSFRFKYPLKKEIGRQVKCDETKMNRIFRELKQNGYIEISEDYQEWRITDKFFVFKKYTEGDNIDMSYQVPTIEEDSVNTTFENVKPRHNFRKSIYFDNQELFEREISNSKWFDGQNIDFAYYHKHIQHYYTIEHPEKCYVDWKFYIQDWIIKDIQQRRAIKKTEPKPEKRAKNDIFKLSDEELKRELNFWRNKVKEPDTEQFSEYVEIAETYKAYAEVALKKGEKFAKKEALAVIKNTLEFVSDKSQLRQYFETYWAEKHKSSVEPPPS